jgi:PKD repeat protein
MNKKLHLMLLTLPLFIAVLSVAQSSDGAAQQPLSNGKDPMEALPMRSAERTEIIISPNGAARTISSCNCWIQRDRAWQVVPFTNSSPPDYRNDDGSSPAINLISPFCFYGTYQRKVFINNNGNISFGTSYSAFRADSFPNTNFVMIAPFWSDVDTRGPNSGLVYYQLTNSHLIVQWDSVGYFNAQDDKLNAFQLIITDGQDPLLPSGYNVGFCYKDMQWTTGNASQGVGGFGGIPATVGVNEGNGINYIQMGRFDQPGSLYDGPGGNPDGVSFLDNQVFLFNTCVSNFNIAPVVSSLSVCDTIELCMGDSTDISASFLGPEPGQQVAPAVTLGGMQDVSVTGLVSGAIGSASIHVNGTVNNIGFHTIQIQGTDNGTPVQTTSTRVTIRVIGPPTAQFFATPDTGTVFIFDNYSLGSSSTFWDFGDGTSGYSQFDTVHFYPTPGVYTVTMVVFSDEGCSSDTAVQTITVVNNGVGILEPSSLPPVHVLPNPSSGRIRILSRSMTTFDLRITDLAGRPVYDIDSVYSGDEVDLRSLTRGVYFYVLREKGSRSVRSGKLVIE